MPEIITIISTGLGVLNSLFGSGQVFGADFEARKTKIQGWMSSFGLAGSNGKYINPDVLQSFAVEDAGNPSAYSMNGGVWQNDIQQYFSAIKHNLSGTIADVESQRFNNIANDYIQKVKTNADNTGGLPIDNKPNPFLGSIGGLNSNIIFLIIGAGILVTMFVTGKLKI